MGILCINHDNHRDLSQLAWAIFGNLDVDIKSEFVGENIITSIDFEGEFFTQKTEFNEKNDFKRSLLQCAFQIKEWDVPWGILTGINPAKLAFNDFDIDEFSAKYLMKKERAKLCGDVAEFTKKISVKPDDMSIYIGIPFCKTKCKYCSFVSNSIDTANRYMDRYVECLISEIKAVSNQVLNRKIRAIYIGGGTPTALNEQNLELVMQAVSENFDFSNLYEYTVEAGRVDTITDEKLRIIKEYGADRISINPQIFDDDVLKQIGRLHTSEDVISAYEKAKKLNFKAINMDIIYGLGGKFEHTVDVLMKLNPENITIHTLAIKKGSLFSKEYTANLTEIDYFYNKINENYKPYYMYRQQHMIKPYENVGFMRQDTPCLYNIYMMENLMDILALGSGSTSKIKSESYFNNKYPLDYINNIDQIIEKKLQILKEI